MHALQTAVRMIAGAGDEVVIPTPAWPNFAGALSVVGARVAQVPMTSAETGWQLDLDRLDAAVTARTRAIVVNSPANPTGWTASRDELAAILSIARRRGLWIVADEIYARFAYDPARMVEGRAPSFRDVMEPQDRILFVQTFSKNWAMTGWRIGWLEAPAALGQVIENLIQYSTSGVPAFQQRAAIAALDHGESFVAHQIERARRGRAIVCDGLLATGKVELPPPPGAFYAFLKVKGVSDSRALALRLVDEANVGLAPGTAFGDGGQGYLRLCFARKSEDLEEAVRRLRRRARGVTAILAQTVQVLVAALGGFAFHLLGIPAAWMSGAMVAVVILGAFGRSRPLPRPLADAAMLVSGATMGGGITPEALAAVTRYPASLALLVLAVAAGAAASMLWLTRVAGWRSDDALLASAPGALSTVLVIAVERKAAVGAIVVVQSVRLFVLIALLPSLVVFLGGGAPGSRLPGEGMPLESPAGLARSSSAGWRSARAGAPAARGADPPRRDARQRDPARHRLRAGRGAAAARRSSGWC
jgi:membrane AbrB-like protein